MSASASDSVLGMGIRVNGKKKTCQFELEKERDVADRPPRALAESASCPGGRRNTIFLLPRKNSSAPEMQQKEKKPFLM